MPVAGPLSGIAFVDLARVLAGPDSAMLPADRPVPDFDGETDASLREIAR